MEEEKESSLPRISRRDFLKLLGKGAIAATLSGEVFNTLMGQWEEEIKGEPPPLENSLSKYIVAWDAKPWVWINLALAAEKLNGIKIPPGGKLSLIEALGLDRMSHVSRKNTDPRKGYIAAQMSEEIGGWGYGLCLVATAIFRAALKAPLIIEEAGTHYDIYSDYFKDRNWPLGTDAAIFNPDPDDTAPKVDLVLRNPTNQEITLIFEVFDDEGKPLSPPKEELSLLIYKASYLYHLVAILRRKLDQKTGIIFPRQYFPEYTFSNRRILVRAAFRSPKEIPFSADFTPPKSTGDTHRNVTFERTLILNNDEVYHQTFTSQYGLSQSGENF